MLLIDTKVANRRPTVKFSLDQRPLGSSIFNIQQFFDIVVPRLDLRNENCCYKLSVITIIFLTNVKASIIFEAAVAFDYVAFQILGDIFFPPSHFLAGLSCVTIYFHKSLSFKMYRLLSMKDTVF